MNKCFRNQINKKFKKAIKDRLNEKCKEVQSKIISEKTDPSYR